MNNKGKDHLAHPLNPISPSVIILTLFKKAKGILQLPPSIHPSCYLLLSHWTKSNQIWCVCVAHMNEACKGTFFWPRPLGPWGGAKRSNIIKYHKISISKSISNIFKPNFVCLLTNGRYQTNQTGFSLGCLGHVPQGRGLGVHWGFGVKKKFSEIQPELVCELLT